MYLYLKSCYMTERRRTYRRGTRKRAAADQPSPESLEQQQTTAEEADPYLDASTEAATPPKRTSRTKRGAPRASKSKKATEASPPPAAETLPPPDETPSLFSEHVLDNVASSEGSRSEAPADSAPAEQQSTPTEGVTEGGREEYRNNGHYRGRYRRFRHRKQGGQGFGAQGQGQQHKHNGNYSGRRHRRYKYDNVPRGPIGPITVEGEATGWFDTHRESGFIRSASNSYLADPSDPFVPMHLVRQYGLRRGDLITASVGRDQRNRVVVADILSINEADPAAAASRPEFQSLVASYPDRKLALETGKPAKGGPELTRRAIDLIAPIGYGQRALIVAPARAGKTMLLQAVIEGIAINHPEAALFILLVDERPEEVSDMITLGYGEVIASSFDMPAARHTDVAEMTLERARRLVELGKDVVIVLDSITRLARAYNTVERGTGRTLSGGLDSSAMARPKAFFGSARSVSEQHGGGSLTIIATALVETGSRMDDVIFEEFKGTGNCEIKLDRSLAEKRIFPAIDIPVSGTRREDKLFRPDQLEHVYTLRRGLQQMPSSAAMEWLIKRIANTQNNDALLSGL
jgi:transcription termination factor Rho